MVLIYDGIFTNELEEKYHSYFECISHELSDFQKYSIKSIVDGHHSLVMAKTGCGKTVSADFAIQYFVNQGKQVIYTSPIKALSNQQFYNFSRKYPNISFGIFTGDIKFNPMADVIFATAEIVNNFFMNTNTMNDFQMDVNKLGCLIIDEVHFFLNKERGHVWENTILMLPKHVQMVMLSATLDNPMKFASWCEELDISRKVSISSMKNRIVPLIHYSFLTTTESIFKKVKDKNIQSTIRQNTNELMLLQVDNNFMDSTYNKIKQMTNHFQNNRVFIKRNFVINQLLSLLKKDDLLPALLFAFSRKNVERIAKDITVNLLEDDSKIPYTIREESFQIMRKLPNFQEYLNLPEYDELMKLFEKGIGIHHSGMIPVLRELVEIFISKKYIKVLVATSSFSIGLDCAIRTTVFTSLKQYDGKNESYLLPHDYTQMSGRCGRRNIDVQGYVIHCNNLFSLPSLREYKEILSGKLQKMISQYHISYHTILNMIPNTMECMIKNVEKSMMGQDNKNEIVFYDRELQLVLDKKSEKEQMMNSLKTPVFVMTEYNDLSILLNNSNSNIKEKKRKEIEKRIGSFIEEYKSCVRDTKIYNEYILFKNNLFITIQEQEQRKKVISHQIQSICTILQSRDYITDQYTLCNIGNFAKNINEIHPLQTSECMFDDHDITLKEIAAIYSCFTNIRVKNDVKKNSLDESTPHWIKLKLEYISSLYHSMEQKEQEENLDTGINYENRIHYDLFYEIQLWVDAKNEIECKEVLQKVQSKGISIGDFSKAILKISAIGHEISFCHGKNNGLSDKIYHILSQLDSVLLKFVCTNQSLYI